MTLLPLLAYASATLSLALAFGSLWRAHRSVADWTFFAGMLVLAVENIFSGFGGSTADPDQIIYWHHWRLVVLSLLPGFWLVFSLSYARGNARQFLGKWRMPLVAALLLPLGVVTAFNDDLATALIPSTTGPHSMVHLGSAGMGVVLFLLVGSILVLMNLERTFRASMGTLRWRIKFMLMGVGVLFIVRLYTSSQALLFRGIDPSFQSVNAAALLIAAALMLRSLFRTGRFTLDVYPSQFVLQGSFTALLAGIYLLIIGVFAKVVTYFGGDSAFGLNALLMLVSLVLLAVLLQSDHFRLSLHRFISRNFQRPLYDYRTMWRQFTEATASRVEQGDLCRSLVKLTADMFQALSVSIWLVDEKGEAMTLAASTSLSEAQGKDIGPQKADSGAVIKYFQLHPEPVDIEASRSPWATALRQWHPGEFANGGHRLCIPLIGRGEILGLITLGDRVGGGTYSLQDFDMLKCVGDHAAASLLNVRLSQRLLQAKELEAFQTMAAFFVHDLKNAASTLNLMLQNAPVHFDDPEFRQDALRGLSKTGSHINRLIGRLSLLRHELKIQATEVSLTEVVTGSLAGFEILPGITLVKDLMPLPKTPIDHEQMGKVVTNLILNASEAMGGKGEIHVTTSEDKDWVVLSVKDTGSGMTPEFIQHSLFRPFQTTKKTGLGIGMFQSKMIVEAHRGRISVASESGKGTTFQVLLPRAAS